MLGHPTDPALREADPQSHVLDGTMQPLAGHQLQAVLRGGAVEDADLGRLEDDLQQASYQGSDMAFFAIGVELADEIRERDEEKRQRVVLLLHAAESAAKLHAVLGLVGPGAPVTGVPERSVQPRNQKADAGSHQKKL